MNYIVQTFKEPFPHLTVANLYNKEELDLIWEELVFLTKPEKFIQDNWGTGVDQSTGIVKSFSKAIVLDEIYSDRKISNILAVNRKAFNQEIIIAFSEISPMCKSILQQNHDLTKIRYYENEDEYLPHTDTYNYTGITFFYKEPKSFEGGELFFPEYDYTFHCKNNSMILFPSCIEHAATKVQMINEGSCSGNGRYSMMQFLKLI